MKLNLTRPGSANVHQLMWSWLAQAMACCQLGTKQLSEQMLSIGNAANKLLVDLNKIQTFSVRKVYSGKFLQNVTCLLELQILIWWLTSCILFVCYIQNSLSLNCLSQRMLCCNEVWSNFGPTGFNQILLTDWGWVMHICISDVTPSLIQTVACRLADTKPLSEPMLEYC